MSALNRGKFITFEGIDGCGKSTQVEMFAERLRKTGIEVKVVREPGGTRVSESIREILLHRDTEELDGRTEALLMTASRAQVTKEEILPALEAGIWVIADRYADSTLAYQGGGRDLDLEWLIELNRFATFTVTPDLTFFVDIDPAIGYGRQKTNKDRIERAGFEFQKKVRKTYLEIAERFSDRIVVILGSGEINVVHNNIWSKLHTFLGK